MTNPSSDPEPMRVEDLPVAYQRGTSTEGILPIAGYVVGDQLGSRFLSDDAGVRLAVVLMTAAAVWAIVQRVRRGKAIGWWIPSVAAYLFVRGVAGLLWGEDVFLAIGIGLKVALGLAALISVIVRRPFAAELAPLVLPFSKSVQQHPLYFSTMRNVTLSYALYQLASVGFEIWLLGATESGTGFLIIRTLVGWVAGIVGFILIALYADRSLRHIPGFDGVMALFERIGLALEADRVDRRKTRS